MLCLTKIKRSYIIDHVMPSDLDDTDIKNGLYLKEKMLEEVTDDYIKEKYPNWKEIEREYRKNGLTDTIDKIMCGEMDSVDLTRSEPVRCDVWMRYKEFKTGEVRKKAYDPDDIERYEVYDFDRLEGYSSWKKQGENDVFDLKDVSDIMVQFQLAIIGKYAIRYYPFQDASHYNGFFFVNDLIHIYNPQLWERHPENGMLTSDIDKQSEYYRLFFKNYKGYYTYEFESDYDDWIEEEYPGETVRTLQTDPIRIKCDSSGNAKGDFLTLSGRQWIKTKYIKETSSAAVFSLKIDNLIGV